MNHWISYANTFEKGDPRPLSFQRTSNNFVRQVVSKFNHTSRVNGLLFGQVQSGKTTHTFSVIAATADADPGFNTFLYLTSNSTQLHLQTLGDALQRLNQTFEVCGPDDELRFRRTLHKPSIIVLNKDPRVLAKWSGILSASERTPNYPMFIVDDEGDSASQNTKVNQGDQSRIHSLIREFRELGTGSVYLQVTATPQALFLQSAQSGEKPKFIHYFDPGAEYKGGEFFFGGEDTTTHRSISDDDVDNMLIDGKPSRGITEALSSFVCVVAYFKHQEKSNANCLIHPHYSRSAHVLMHKVVEDLLVKLLEREPEDWVKIELEKAHTDLMRQVEEPMSLEDFWNHHRLGLEISTRIINADNKVSEEDYRSGFNVIVGANAIGRGVAFPHLQTVYYARKAKTPQADTFWQHSRIFGYDRDWRCLRIFMPPSLFRLFRVLQDQNSRLIEMIKRGENEILQVPLPKGVSATRSLVVDRKRYRFIVGGANYFPPNPDQTNGEFLDKLFSDYGDNFTGPVSIDVIKLALTKASEPDADWKTKSFLKAIEHYSAEPKATLLLRRGRKISANTGSMLSPNDREFGDGLPGQVVMTAYRIDGEQGGWSRGLAFWLLNIRLPGGLFYHEVE